MSAKHDLEILGYLEACMETLSSTLWKLSKKYDAHVSTPYVEENIGDVRSAIEKGVEQEEYIWNVAKDLEINDQCGGLYEDTERVIDGETYKYGGGGMSPEAYYKLIKELEKED